MRSLSEREETSPPWEIVTAGVVSIGFIVCSVVFAKVAYTIVALFLHSATYALRITLY